jgi:PQQ-dependent catabolism-associated CXXCW motif protein
MATNRSILALAIAFAVAGSAFGKDASPGTDPATGYRIGNYRAPTPASVPGALTISTKDAQAMIAEGAVLIDVLGAKGGGPDPLDGEWRLTERHETIAGAVWLPNVGTGTLDAQMTRYFHEQLARLAGPPPGRALVIFCQADCWMSWNAAKRAASWGYDKIAWYPLGTDGWRDAGLPLVAAPTPPPVPVD